jgi:type I restriction enzyme, S subunit
VIAASHVVPNGYQRTEVGVIPNDWNVVPITDATRNIFLGLTSWVDYVDHGGVPLVRATDIAGGRLSFDAARDISVRQHKKLTQYRKPSRGDVLVSKSGSLGVCAVVDTDREFSIYESIIVLQPRPTLDSGFLLHLMRAEETQTRMIGERVGSTVSHLNLMIFRELRIPIPPTLGEQEAIAEALGDADALIESLEQLVAKKRHLKQAAMQQLLTGKKRLPGFEGEWKRKRLPDICWFQEGPGVRNKQFTTSGVKLLNGTNIFRGALDLDTTTRFIAHKEAHGPYAHFLADAGDIVIASSGITIDRFHEKVAYVRDADLPFCMNTSTIRFKPKSDSLSDDYLFQFLCSGDFKEAIGGQATGSAQLNFGPSHLAKVDLPTPPLAEQTAIAQVLTDMDTEIEAIEAKLAKARQIKQGMMHELLTGRTRLV